MRPLAEVPATDISTERRTSGSRGRPGTVASNVPLAVPQGDLLGGVLRSLAGSPFQPGAPSQDCGGGDPASGRAVKARFPGEAQSSVCEGLRWRLGTPREDPRDARTGQATVPADLDADPARSAWTVTGDPGGLGPHIALDPEAIVRGKHGRTQGAPSVEAEGIMPRCVACGQRALGYCAGCGDGPFCGFCAPQCGRCPARLCIARRCIRWHQCRPPVAPQSQEPPVTPGTYKDFERQGGCSCRRGQCDFGRA